MAPAVGLTLRCACCRPLRAGPSRRYAPRLKPEPVCCRILPGSPPGAYAIRAQKETGVRWDARLRSNWLPSCNSDRTNPPKAGWEITPFFTRAYDKGSLFVRGCKPAGLAQTSKISQRRWHQHERDQERDNPILTGLRYLGVFEGESVSLPIMSSISPNSAHKVFGPNSKAGILYQWYFSSCGTSVLMLVGDLLSPWL